MLLVCEQCGNVKTDLYKLPFALYIEENCLSFPKNKDAYMNLCFDCLIGNNPYKERLEQ